MIDYTGISENALIVAHNVTIEITCTGTAILPIWFLHGNWKLWVGMFVHKEILTPTGISRNAMIVAHNVTVKLKCTGETILPTWFVNDTVVGTGGHCYTPIISGSALIYTLLIDGNRICDTMNFHCTALRGGRLLSIHNISLTFQGKLHCLANQCWCKYLVFQDMTAIVYHNLQP